MKNLALLLALLFSFNSLAYLSGPGGGGGGGGTWGSITGTVGDQADLQAALDAKADLANTILVKTASHILVLTDRKTTLIRMNVASANTVTIPPNSSVAFPIGTQIMFSQMGAGQVTLTPGSGVTLIGADSAFKSRIQGAVFGIFQVAADTWLAFGDLSS